jgi:hypothetical protein
MCPLAADPAAHLDVVSQLVELAVGNVPKLLGALPPLRVLEPFARVMLDSEPFQIWLFSVPMYPNNDRFRKTSSSSQENATDCRDNNTSRLSPFCSPQHRRSRFHGPQSIREE